YTEVSPSGTGVHIIIRGLLPSGRGNQIPHHEGKVEMFSRDRYFTFTGMRVDGTYTEIRDRHTELLSLHSELFAARRPRTVDRDSAPSSALLASDADLIKKACSAKNGAKFERLWTGQWGEYPSQSEADAALCTHLAFWTGKDRTRMEALFRRSGLIRKKWERKGYRDETLTKAIAITTDTWNPSQHGQREKPARGKNYVEPGIEQLPPAESTAAWTTPVPFHQFGLPPFPVDSLSGWLRAFIEAEALATQTP